MKTENETNEKNLNEFLEFCKEQFEFIEIQTYVNWVTVHFDNSISVNVFIRLNAINYNYFVFNSHISDINSIVLLIFKKKNL